MTVRSTLSSTLCASAALALATGCAQDVDSDVLLFEPFNTAQAVTPSAVISIQERWLAYMAFELETNVAGNDFNGDGDTNDQIAFLIDMVARSTFGLETAVRDLKVVGDHLYLVVAEADDEVDWNNDGDGATMTWDDLVLLHCPAAAASAANIAFIATLESGFTGAISSPRILATTSRVYFSDDPAALVAPETTLNYVSTSAPATPVRVSNADALNPLSPRLLAIDDDLLFVTLDENVEMRQLNGDGDPTPDDAFVLALVDANATVPLVREVGLALENASTPVRAFARGAGDWIVGFLVDEQAQGALSRNAWLLDGSLPDSLLPGHCVGSAIDQDASDQVLGYLEWAAWVAGSASQPVNTGLAGHKRVLAMQSGAFYYIATIVPEADEGNCNLNSLNDDDDFVDDVLRWVRVESVYGASGIYTDSDGLVALADIDGGTRGITDLDGRWIAVVDEDADDRDHDGQLAEHDVIGWLDPTDGNGAVWKFDHGTGAGTQAAGTAWMAERDERDYLLVAFQESVYGFGINSSDSDLNDSVPTFARFDPTNADDLDFPGPAIAVERDNAGIAVANGYAFYRVDEQDDNRDWSGDGVKDDLVLFSTQLSNMNNTNLVSAISGDNRPALQGGPGNVGAVFVFDEAQSNFDLNGDGDVNDRVLRWMRIGP